MKKSVGLFLLMVLLLARPSLAAEGARDGLLLWYSSVVPALFPFLVLSSLLSSGGGLALFMKPVSALLTPVFGLSAPGCYALVSGLLCGYPMGAKTTADFLREGTISEAEGKFLMAVCNHPSPMFLLGYVYPYFEKELPLWKFLLSVYSPVLLLAAAARLLYGKPVPGPSLRPDASSAVSLDAAILSSAEVLCKIGGCLMVYSIAIVFLRHGTVLSLRLRLALTAAMEMTTGVREAARLLPYPYSAALSVFSVTFGGLSGISQTAAVFGNRKKAGLSIRPYVCWKLVHGGLSAGTLLLLSRGIF